MVMMIRIWQSGQVMEFGDLPGGCSKYWRLIFGRQLYTVSPVSLSLTTSVSGEIGEGTYYDSVLPLCAYTLVGVYFVTHPECLGCLQTTL